MTIQQAIEKAIEGGWKWRKSFRYPPTMEARPKEAIVLSKSLIERVLLTASFWQCLGKEMGWDKTYCSACWRSHGGYKADCDAGFGEEWDAWLFHLHCFIDSLAEGKSAEDYFASL